MENHIDMIKTNKLIIENRIENDFQYYASTIFAETLIVLSHINIHLIIMKPHDNYQNKLKNLSYSL